MWALADITMGGMTLINLPVCMILGGIAFKALKDYERQKKMKVNPKFKFSNIGLKKEPDEYWEE